MTSRICTSTAVAASILTLGGTLSHAGIVLTTEAPGVYQSSVAGVTTETFDGTAGSGVWARPIGLYLDRASLLPASTLPADLFGGAGGTDYLSVDAGHQVVIDLWSPMRYFGMWLSAGDPGNRVTFITLTGSGFEEVWSFDLGFLSSLPSDYFGNPVPGPFQGLNLGEPYAYLNFTATDGTTFDTIILEQIGGGAFESDNHSVTDRVIVPPSSSVPDGGSLTFVFLGAMATLAGWSRRVGGRRPCVC